jgi:methyl-accepting chemotaxis protein
VEGGTRVVDVAGRTMGEVVENVKQVTRMVDEIAAASDEQRSGIEQVNTAVVRMEQVVQKNAALVEQTTSATHALNAQAGALLEVVSQFQLEARDEEARAVSGQSPQGS